ncbi:MAG: DUF262 domain-containing protein [Muribaculaceae bacterium]|nr:DUF262 domain-containing protein [Muribaculaceae bacterium]
MTNQISHKPSAMFIRQIINEITDGKVAVPAFQRNYVWTKEQVIDLFDSIKRGFPIGTVLLWGGDGSIKGTRNILTDKIDPEGTAKLYVLDGRQRLSTFYGCTLDSDDKADVFRLAYNLETEEFEYPDSRCDNPLVVPVSKLFDTFALLGSLQNIQNSVDGDTSIYVERAKSINAILQEYTMSRVDIENCDLADAEIVFARINEKGTPISKTFMLQATTYDCSAPLLTEIIDSILESLTTCGFDSLSQDDILNCFFKFVGKNFFDSFKSTEIEKLKILEHTDEVRRTAIQAASFLNQWCRVPGASLLPYKKQFIALTWFFRKHPAPDNRQFVALRKWFNITSWNQSFQNNSLSNVRRQFRIMEDLIAGDYSFIDSLTLDSWISQTGIDYDFNVSTKTSRSSLLLLAMLYAKSPDKLLEYHEHIRIRGSKAPNVIIVSTPEEKKLLSCLTSKNVQACNIPDDSMLKPFLLSNELLHMLHNKEEKRFIDARASIIRQAEVNLMEYMLSDRTL